MRRLCALALIVVALAVRASAAHGQRVGDAARAATARRGAPCSAAAPCAVATALSGAHIAPRRRHTLRRVILPVAGALVGGALGAAFAQGQCERPRCDAWKRGLAAGAAIGAVGGLLVAVMLR